MLQFDDNSYLSPFPLHKAVNGQTTHRSPIKSCKHRHKQATYITPATLCLSIESFTQLPVVGVIKAHSDTIQYPQLYRADVTKHSQAHYMAPHTLWDEFTEAGNRNVTMTQAKSTDYILEIGVAIPTTQTSTVKAGYFDFTSTTDGDGGLLNHSYLQKPRIKPTVETHSVQYESVVYNHPQIQDVPNYLAFISTSGIIWYYQIGGEF